MQTPRMETAKPYVIIAYHRQGAKENLIGGKRRVIENPLPLVRVPMYIGIRTSGDAVLLIR